MKSTLTPFIVQVDLPCGENWNNMLPDGKGRFCLNCKKQVIDFSSMSDPELQHFLHHSGSIPCGRFHQTQLNRMIGMAPSPVTKTSFPLPRAAAVLILWSLQLQAAAVQTDRQLYSAEHKKKQSCYLPGDSIILSGSVRDIQKKPLESAEIVFNGKLVSHTDKEGRFSFVLPDITSTGIKNFQLVAGFPGLNNAVRNYHPAMGSTSYDFTLYEPAGESSFHTMVVPRIENRIAPLLLSFRKNELKVKPDTRTALAELALQMKNNPFIHMALIISGQPADAVPSIKFRQEIIRVLEEEEGIAPERFRLTETADKNQKAFTLLIRQVVTE